MGRRNIRGDVIDLHVIREATKLIWRDGVHHLKMDEIATRSNLSRATLYYRFGSRSRLILFTRHSIMVELLHHANNMVSTAPKRSQRLKEDGAK